MTNTHAVSSYVYVVTIRLVVKKIVKSLYDFHYFSGRQINERMVPVNFPRSNNMKYLERAFHKKR